MQCDVMGMTYPGDKCLCSIENGSDAYCFKEQCPVHGKPDDKICPKCGKPYDVKTLFRAPDHKGTVAMCCHDPYTIHHSFGSSIGWRCRCFLNLQEAKQIFDIIKCPKCGTYQTKDNPQCVHLSKPIMVPMYYEEGLFQ